MKRLWSGTFTSGSITVPDIEKYNLIAVSLSNGLMCFGTRYYGSCNLVEYGKYTIQPCGYRFGGSDNTVTIDTGSKGASDGTNQLTVTGIYGLIKTKY